MTNQGPDTLPGLPPTGDEFWEYADTEIQKAFKPQPCEHFFVHKTAVEIECRSCRIGFFLSPGFYVVEGSIVSPDGIVIRLQGDSLVNG